MSGFSFVFLLFLVSNTFFSFAGDTLYFKLHFVYGSTPKRAFKSTEPKYFGGIHGGHVYMEVDHEIVSFGPNNGQWHIIGHKKKIVGKYRIDKDLIWSGDTGKLKITTIEIPITKQQLEQFKLAEKHYLEKAPYDYAFIGMRCAAGAYDMLSKVGVCKQRSHAGMILKNFYPKRLRIKLLKRAVKEHWKVTRQEGRYTRHWEKD